MRTVYVSLEKTNSFNIGHQYEHKATLVKFMNLDYQGSLYIRLEINDYKNMVPLTADSFLVGKPLTFHSGVVKGQLYSMTADGDYEQLSKVFSMIIDKSIGYQDPSDYPVDPNVELIYEELKTLKTECTTARDQCNTAYQQCDQVTNACVSATQLCNEAVNDIGDSISDSNAATQSCNQATATANQKIQEMNDILDSFSGLDIDNLSQQISEFQQTLNQLQNDLESMSNGSEEVMVEQ